MTYIAAVKSFAVPVAVTTHPRLHNVYAIADLERSWTLLDADVAALGSGLGFFMSSDANQSNSSSTWSLVLLRLGIMLSGRLERKLVL
jgi:hypothetical protein